MTPARALERLALHSLVRCLRALWPQAPRADRRVLRSNFFLHWSLREACLRALLLRSSGWGRWGGVGPAPLQFCARLLRRRDARSRCSAACKTCSHTVNAIARRQVGTALRRLAAAYGVGDARRLSREQRPSPRTPRWTRAEMAKQARRLAPRSHNAERAPAHALTHVRCRISAAAAGRARLLDSTRALGL